MKVSQQAQSAVASEIGATKTQSNQLNSSTKVVASRVIAAPKPMQASDSRANLASITAANVAGFASRLSGSATGMRV